MLTHHRARLEWRREDRVVRFGGIIRYDKNKFTWAASSVAPLFIVCPPPILSLSPEKSLFVSVHALWLKKASPIKRSTGRRKWPNGTRRRSTGLPSFPIEQDGTVRTANDFWPAYSLSCFYLFFFINCFPSLFCFYFAGKKQTKKERGRETRFFPPSDRKREDLSVHLRSSRGHPVVSPYRREGGKKRRRAKKQKRREDGHRFGNYSNIFFIHQSSYLTAFCDSHDAPSFFSSI